jgi:cold shock CspA family protein
MASRAIPARPIHFACAVEVKDTSMATGTVKWFNPHEAGFLQPSGGGRDVATLVERQKVSYDVVTTDRGRTAAGIQDRPSRRNRATQS